jgi:hypothetical protein
VSSVAKSRALAANMAQRAREKRSKGLISGGDLRELHAETSFGLRRILDGLPSNPDIWDFA